MTNSESDQLFISFFFFSIFSHLDYLLELSPRLNVKFSFDTLDGNTSICLKRMACGLGFVWFVGGSGDKGSSLIAIRDVEVFGKLVNCYCLGTVPV